MLKRGMTLLCAATGTVVDYSPWVERLRFASTSPGGFGELRARLRLPPTRARLPQPEFGILSGRVVVWDGRDCVYCGEITEAALTLDASGDYVDLAAQGGANALADDPQDSSYANQTAGAIIAAEFSRRSAYLAVDADLAAVLPNAPTATFSPFFDGRSIEDILHELSDLLGDYAWGVWNHSTHRDALGLPTWQLAMHPRDTATVSLRAGLADIVSWQIAPAATRAYNGVTLHYLDATAGPGSVTVTDGRLNGDQSQGSAPFRFRRFRRDMSSRMLTASQASALASQYLAAFQNVSNVIQVRLATVRNAQGTPIPLPRVRADANIAIPELLTRAAGFAVPPALVAGTNLFYIRQATYEEVPNQTPTVTLLLDQVADFAAADLTRLRYEEQLRQRSRRGNVPVQPAGLTVKGAWSVIFAGSGLWGSSLALPAVLAAAPTSITFTAQSVSNIASGPFASNFSVWGCDAYVAASTVGSNWWIGFFQTNGNCLREVDPIAGTLRHHCDACGTLSDALPIAGAIEVGTVVGQAAYALTCQACGARECLNPALTAADEADPNPTRAAQAGAIRAALRALGATL